MSGAKLSKFSRICLAGAALLFTASMLVSDNQALAQEQQGQLLLVEDCTVKPSRGGEFEKAIKEIIALATEHNFKYYWYAWSGEFHYYFAIPVENYSDVENYYLAFSELEQKIGEEKFQAWYKRAAYNCESWRYLLRRHQPELSYSPANPRLQPGEGNFLQWQSLYVIPGKERDCQAALKQWLALCKEKNISDGYEVYIDEIGQDAPYYGLAARARNVVDLHNQQVNIWELFGEDGRSLQQKTLSLLRKYEEINAWYRPELSYTPPEE